VSEGRRLSRALGLAPAADAAATPGTAPTASSPGAAAPGSKRPAGSPATLTERDIRGLVFTAEMYALQADHLAAVLGVSGARARAISARWRGYGYADSARLGPGRAWVWLTRRGLAACGLPYTAAPPPLSRLAHLRAVTAVRLAFEAAPTFITAGAYWRGERRLRARIGRIGLREHVPDGEVHWPEAPGVPYPGECWAIEAELTAKTVTRTASIMRELLARTGDYGCPAAERQVPGAPRRHTRAVYLCSPAARPTVTRARGMFAAGDAERIEIAGLPGGAAM
jgi:hypothetical protein